ncbi:tripartite motif-containing protein 45 [Anopheles cruzii]|uniref:tripartite motif-containing protein 45 n=1 Tax=Anopheles cruzii TaxID=68878 RepID=UPI0022EC6D84|nr:tripartite motif-containing protein 45 [Anopheles cruzii]
MPTDSGASPPGDESEDEAESDYDGQRRPSAIRGRPPADAPADAERYVRLQEEEHIEPSVVVLKNGFGHPPEGGPVTVESLLKAGGKLTFNLTPEQLGLPPVPATGGRANRHLRTPCDRSSPVPPAEGWPRKSSLRRGSMYGSQPDLVVAEPTPAPGSKTMPLSTAGCSPGPARLDDDHSLGSRGSLGSTVSCGHRLQQRVRHKFDEISTVYDHFPTEFLAARYLCALCRKLLREPRVLDCLHTFCRPCLERYGAVSGGHQDSALFWSHISDSIGFEWDPISNDKEPASLDAEPLNSNHVAETPGAGESRFGQLRTSLQSFREQHCLRSPVRSEKVCGKDKVRAQVMMYGDKDKVLVCPTCSQPTELAGGVAQLPQHFVLARKIEHIVRQYGQSSPTAAPCRPPSSAYCELCSDEVTATACCTTCSLQLCTLCKEAHRRQRSTAAHAIVRSGMELLSPPWGRVGRDQATVTDSPKTTVRCPMHPEQQLKLFCTTCHRVVCGECSALVHQDHRCTSVARAGKVYGRFVTSAIEQTRPLEDYALQAVGKLNDLTVRVNGRCEAVQREMDAFVDEYVAALEEHRKSLAGQIADIRQAKLEMIMAQRLDLERRSQNARAAIDFAEELMAEGSDVENLVFVNILLKRFEQCLRTTRATDGRVTDTVQFLADEEAPSARVQTGVPLYGIVTTQKADPRQCTVEHPGAELATLKAHKRVLLTLVVRDYDGRRLAYGGLTVHTDLRYRDDEAHAVAMALVDNRDGSYGLSFTPPRAGVMHLAITVDGRTIEECPIVLRIHKLRPHYGVYHCCAFCSSGGSRASTCACGSIMPGGYRGCGHGYEGHPGQRHWSCCGSSQEHSDCTARRSKANV